MLSTLLTLWRRLPVHAFLLATLLSGSAMAAEAGVARVYRVPAGPMEETVKRLAAQSGLEILISGDAAAGLRTQPVDGEMTARAALDVMLKGTGLSVLEEPQSGALLLTRAGDPKAPRVARATPAAPTRTQAAEGRREAGDYTVLSPFLVESTTDVGYRASVSSSGSRLNTDYKDIASHLEVMTADFLTDIGAFTIEEAFNYSANTESPSESWGAGASTGDGFLGSGTASMAPSRTRGLSRVTTTRNYFRTFLPYDSYNAFERGLTIASGPNPGLFGLGSPSGINNTDFNRAILNRAKTQVRLMADSNGSRRADLDYNLPLLPGKLATRVDALVSDKQYPFKGNYAKDKRVTGIVTWAPTRRLTLDFYGEHIDRRASVPFYSLPTDAASVWFNPGIGNRTPYNSPEVGPDGPARANIPGNNAYLNTWVAAAADAPTYTFGGNRAPGVYSYRYTATTSTLARYANQVLGLAPQIGTPTLQDERLYPFKSHGLFGASRPSILTGKNFTAIGNLKLAENLYLEFGANYQRATERNATLYSPADIALYVDPNLYGYNQGYTPLDPITAGATQAGNRAANAAQRVANANYGSLYIDGSEAAIYKENVAKQARFSLAYDLDPVKRFGLGGIAARLLSRQRLLGTVSSTDSSLISQRFSRLVMDNVDSQGRPVAPGVITAANARAGSARYMVAANRVFRIRQYIDPNDPANATGQVPFDAFGTWRFTDAAGQPYNVGLLPGNVASGSRSTDDAGSLVYQGYFLRNRLILTYTRSYDRVSTKLLDPAASAISVDTGLAPYYPQVPWSRFERAPTFVNSSKSAVVHALSWLSFHYNESTNADPAPPTSHAIDGSLNAFSDGENKEYGVQFSWRGLGLGINQYRTWQTNVDVGNAYGNVGLLLPSDRLEARYIELQRSRTRAIGGAEFSDFYGKSGSAPGYNPADNGAGSGYYRMFGDNYSKGTEIELSGRLGRLDVRVAVGRTRSVRSNIGPGWLGYALDPVLQRRMESVEWYGFDNASGQYRPVISTTGNGAPVFGAQGATPLRGWQNIRMGDAANAVTMYNQYTQNVLPGALLVEQLEGSTNPLIREWRYNATMAYNIGKGLRAGLSARHRAKALVGYLTETVTREIGGNSVTTQAANLTRPYYSPEQWYFDPFISYRLKLGPMRDVAIQLNAFNVLNNDKIYMNGISASTANRLDVNDLRFTYYGWTDAQAIPAVMQVQDPRTVQLTVTVNF